MIIIDGKSIAAALRGTIADKVSRLENKPCLAVILVGDDPASSVYVNNKIKACAEVGIISIEHRLNTNTDRNTLLALINALNQDQNVHGILLQMPLPPHLNALDMINAIDPDKDVDGLHPLNIGRLVAGLPCLTPCTPQGSLKLIQTVRADLTGLHAVVIGRSLLFGKPMGQLLLNENCTVTQTHSQTVNLADHVRRAGSRDRSPLLREVHRVRNQRFRHGPAAQLLPRVLRRGC